MLRGAAVSVVSVVSQTGKKSGSYSHAGSPLLGNTTTTDLIHRNITTEFHLV